MLSTNSLISRLRSDFPEIHFEFADAFWWSAGQKTVYINPTAAHSHEYCLHELSHAILGHYGYMRDIDLVKLERDAWEYAKTILAPKYAIKIDDGIIQDNLDTYRDWMHNRSTCPKCEATGIEVAKQQYLCLACNNTWKVNEARLCDLRRHSL